MTIRKWNCNLCETSLSRNGLNRFDIRNHLQTVHIDEFKKITDIENKISDLQQDIFKRMKTYGSWISLDELKKK